MKFIGLLLGFIGGMAAAAALIFLFLLLKLYIQYSGTYGGAGGMASFFWMLFGVSVFFSVLALWVASKILK